MGWCSGTQVFDPVTKCILEGKLTRKEKVKLIIELINALEDADWDCHFDSAYSNEPIVLTAFRELHPHWFDSEGYLI